MEYQLKAYNATMAQMVENNARLYDIIIKAINTTFSHDQTDVANAVAVGLLVRTIRDMRSDHVSFWEMRRKGQAIADKKLMDLVAYYETQVAENGLKIHESQLN